MTFDIGQRILDELLVLTSKTLLHCDGKIYKESRNLIQGEYTLSQVAAMEMGLDEDALAEPILGSLLSRSNSWSIPLLSWRRGKNGKSIHFKIDRTAIMRRSLESGNLMSISLNDLNQCRPTLLLCYLNSNESKLSLSQLRCLYLCRLFNQCSAVKSKLVVLANGVVADINSEYFQIAEGEFQSIEGRADSEHREEGISQAKVNALLLAKLLGALDVGGFEKIVIVTPVSNEFVVNEAKRVWLESPSNRGHDVEIFPVHHVTPDEDAMEAWRRKRQLVAKISMERNFSGDEKEISSNKINLIALSSLKFDLLKKSRKSSVSLARDDDGQCDQKAGSFLQYNCARICSLLNQFEELVESGTYPPLPDADDESELPSDEKEWELVFKYLYAHREMIQEMRSIDNCHKLVQWLISFSHDFSAYYNRTRILCDRREHLYPKMFARIRLLLKLKDMLEFWLNFLGLPLLTSI